MRRRRSRRLSVQDANRNPWACCVSPTAIGCRSVCGDRERKPSMETLERILAEHDFFKGLKPETLHLLVSCASNVRFNVGEYLFREGEEAQQFYLLREGYVSLEDTIPNQ